MNARKFHPFQLETVVSKRVSKDLKPSIQPFFLSIFQRCPYISSSKKWSPAYAPFLLLGQTLDIIPFLSSTPQSSSESKTSIKVTEKSVNEDFLLSQQLYNLPYPLFNLKEVG